MNEKKYSNKNCIWEDNDSKAKGGARKIIQKNRCLLYWCSRFELSQWTCHFHQIQRKHLRS